jgi:hypothetical protein
MNDAISLSALCLRVGRRSCIRTKANITASNKTHKERSYQGIWFANGSSESSGQLEKHQPVEDALEKHTDHSSRYHGHLPGNRNNVCKRDHDYLSQIRVITTNDGKEIVSVPVPMTIKSQLGNPTALAIGAFSTTLTTLSLSLMNWRGISITNVSLGTSSSLLELEWSSQHNGSLFWAIAMDIPCCRPLASFMVALERS